MRPEIWPDWINLDAHRLSKISGSFNPFTEKEAPAHYYLHDFVPKGAQEKRTDVLENKADRMWVSNAFYEWTHVKSSTSEGRRQRCSSFLRNLAFTESFSVFCDKMLNITHYNKPTVLLIMQLTVKTQLILQVVIHMSITK